MSKNMKTILIIGAILLVLAITLYLLREKLGISSPKPKLDGTWRWVENPTAPGATVTIRNNTLISHITWGNDLPIVFTSPNTLSITTNTGEIITATFSENVIAFYKGNSWGKIA